VILSLLWLLYAAFGLIQRAIAPLVTPILADLDLSFTEMGLILGSWQLTYIGAALVAGTVIDRWGVHKSLLAGAAILGLSSALRFFVTGFAGMLGAVALSGVGGPMISVGCPKAISLWFDGRRRGTAVGVYLTGPWVGGIVALTLTNSLVMPLLGGSWRHTFLLYGILTFTAALLWCLLGRDADPGASEGAPAMLDRVRSLLRVREVRLVLALGLLTFAVLHALTNWLPTMLETGGFSPASAGLAAALPLAAGTPALLIVPRVVPPLLRGPFLAGSALVALVTILLVMIGSASVQLAALVLFGVIFSPCCSILTLMLMDMPEVGSRHMGTAGGLFFCVAEVGGFLGPLLLGSVVDASGTFLAGQLLFAPLCILTVLLALSLGRRPSVSAW
jgi:sugar phosphate permease